MNLRDIALGTVVYPLATVSADQSTTRDIQSRLISWGYQPGPADGDWGSRTDAAYAQFARDYSYSTTSMTPRTAGHLASLAFRNLQAVANQSATFTLFSLRDNPLIAREIQDKLKGMGYDPGPVDGLWGKTTQAAFTAFAQANQYPGDRLSPKVAQKLLARAAVPPVAAPPPPPPVIEQIPIPIPPPTTDVVVPTEPDNSLTLRDIALGTVTYPLSDIRSNVNVARDIQFRLLSWGYNRGLWMVRGVA
ncbi:MAG: peptidoglycan-binding protein [Alkalinema sp. RL_2_19]|nr:peptidoglycan-binding protein [Alkalinema sp. RL_2_19]